MQKKRVMVGMSGGVDSSVAAALLTEQGYEVTGVTLRLWNEEDVSNEQVKSPCCSLDDVNDARRVCHKLGIRHIVLNMKDMFKSRVVDYFINEYINGRTPNPCIACNRFIKFDEMLRRALVMDYDYIATGHYAEITQNDSGRYLLKKAADEKKDQSYVLYHLTQKQLSHLLLPLSRLKKAEIREIAKRLELPVFNKPDSQEICFVPDNDYAAFLTRSGVPLPKRGHFIDANGNVLGRHEGIWHYTVGQRKGLGIAFGKPMFVTKIDSKNNTVTLGESGSEFTSALTVSQVNLIALESITEPIRAGIKLRYSAKPVLGTISKQSDETLSISLDSPARAVTPGQAAVFYDGDVVLGGGVIV